MDKLKTYIEKHRPQFDAEEPAAGHLERFEAKLTAAQQPTATRRIVKHWGLCAVAASVLLLISFGINWFSSSEQHENPPIEICDDPATMKYCYLSQMNDVAKLIDELIQNIDPFEREIIQLEVASIIEENQSFDEELPTELSPERAQAIMTDYYQHNLEALRGIVEILLIDRS